MRVVYDAGLLARALGEGAGGVVGPAELGGLVVPVLDITPFLLAGQAPAGETGGDSFMIVGGGRLRSMAINDPGAGVEIVINVPAGRAWQPIALRASYIASATVATRIPRLVYNDSALREFVRAPNVLQVGTSQTVIYSWARGINSRVSAGGLLEAGTDIPFEVFIGPGGRIQTTTSAMQAGDTWTGITLSVLEYPT